MQVVPKQQIEEEVRNVRNVRKFSVLTISYCAVCGYCAFMKFELYWSFQVCFYLGLIYKISIFLHL